MKVLLLLVTLSGLAAGQFPSAHRFGSLRTTRRPFVQYRPSVINAGQYSGGGDGQYRPEVYNRNDNNEGRYVPDDSGRYVHMDQPYDGGYGDKGNRGGFYSGDNGRYSHVEGPNGSGSSYKHSGNGLGSYGQASTRTATTYATGLGNKPKITTKPAFSSSSNKDSSKYNIQRTAASRFRTYGDEGGWRILRQDQKLDPVSYAYAYETENKIIGEEVGHLESLGRQDEGIKTSGFYEYYGDDGLKYRVDYTADENGFVPKGAHIHEGIEHAVEFLSKNPN